MNTDALRALWKQAFGDSDAFLDGFFSVGFSPERCNTIEKDGKVSAMLYWFDCFWENKKVAYIYAVATDKAFQNQGLCRALMEDTHCRLRALGYRGAVLVPAREGLFDLYAKFGYRSFCPRETLTQTAAEKSVAITPCTPDSYRQKRETRLPQGSVLQDKKTFSFLATYAKFYEGEDFLFCGGEDEGVFYFQEFLGNTAQIPGILKALDAVSGQYSVSGEQPSAMYLPLDGTEMIPAYFGIALN